MLLMDNGLIDTVLPYGIYTVAYPDQIGSMPIILQEIDTKTSIMETKRDPYPTYQRGKNGRHIINFLELLTNTTSYSMKIRLKHWQVM
jgi:hypothetical protein